MSIRIQNDGIASAASSQISQTQGPAHSTTGAMGGDKGLGGSDRVDLSSLSGAVGSKLTAMASQEGSRVSQLAALYAKGQYQVDATRISRSLITKAISTGPMEDGN